MGSMASLARIIRLIGFRRKTIDSSARVIVPHAVHINDSGTGVNGFSAFSNSIRKPNFGSLST